MQLQVAEEARALLARRRVSGRQIGKMLGWSPAYLSRRLTGQIPFSVADLEALARILRVPISAFFPRFAETTASHLRTPGFLTPLTGLAVAA